MSDQGILKSRRRFLQGFLAAGAMTPFALPHIVRPALAEMATAKRVIFVYVPDGCIPTQWHPKGTEFDFTLPEMTAPLEPIKNHCVFIEGLNMYAGGPTHEGGIRKVLTGAGDVSLDYFLGTKIGQQTPHASLHLGVATAFQNGSGSMTYLGKNRPVMPDDNPLNVFSRVFGKSQPGMNIWQGAAADPLDVSILDSMLADLKDLRGKLGNTEKAKLDTHLESLRELEKRIKTTPNICNTDDFNREGFKVNPKDYYPKTFHKEQHFKLVGKLQMDLMVMALACDMTRVASLMWSHPVSPTKIAETGVSINNHDASHYGNDPNGALAKNFIKLKRWFMDRLLYLVNTLKSRPEGNGTMLDNSLIVLCSELGDGSRHDHKNMPFLLIGGAGGDLTTGRYLKYKEEAHSKLLVSIANTMGVKIDKFGYDGHGKGGLPNLFKS